MKQIIIILASILLLSTNLSAQDRIDKLSDKIDKLAEQILETNKLVAELAKQQAITATKVESIDKRIDSLEKSIEKRLDMQSNFVMIIMGLLAVLIGAIFWDRRSTLKPFETKADELKLENSELKKEIAIIKEKELKLEVYIRQISQIDSRFAPFNP